MPPLVPLIHIHQRGPHFNRGGSNRLSISEHAYKLDDVRPKPIYKGLIPFDVAEVHDGYFSQDKAGHARDTRGNTANDENTYSLIMRDKERLLDPNVALRFIFSHSALREGWDNPNVFQICTLNETQSTEKKRQEIGRCVYRSTKPESAYMTRR